MLTIHARQGAVVQEKADLLIMLHAKGAALVSNALLQKIDTQLTGSLTALMKQDGFIGKTGEAVLYPCLGKIPAGKVLVVGVGDKEKLDVDACRKLGAQLAKRAKSLKAKTVVLAWPEISIEGKTARDLASAVTEGMVLGSYVFHEYKGRLHEAYQKDGHEVERVTITVSDRTTIKAIERGVEEARILADATMLARTLVNTPPNHLLPADMVKVAEQIASESKRISLTILDEEKMKELGMNAALAVGRGSYNGSKGAHLIYRPVGKPKKRIALVGKAVTFDSGGLSIKPADGMMTMKCDMAGAAAVLGVFQALTKLDVSVEVHGIFLAVENMPSGNAYRPGDVVKAMDGTTIEVLNTDAEGRVTLADALSYANTFKPDAMVDLATLTGACVVALGEDVSALMTDDDRLRDRLLTAAKDTGEPLWPLPLYAPYQELIKSKVADIKNIGGGRAGGAITAGLFLQHFVGKTPWAHLDIAGPAFVEKETRPDIPVGGSGYGVRLLLKYLQGI